MAKITFLAYDHCMFSGISAVMDAFSICNAWNQHPSSKNEDLNENENSSLFETEIVTHDGRPFETNGGLQIQAGKGINEVNETDVILIPSFLFGQGPTPDASSHFEGVIEWLKFHYDKEVKIGAGCTGVFLLANTGLLDGKIATTNWQMVKRFRRMFPEVHLKPERIFTHDHGLLCSGAVTSLYHMVLFIIEAFNSKALAQQCAKAFLVDPGRSSQAPYMITQFWKQHGDREITAAQHWMENHYADNIAIDDVAKHVGLSPRHFKRRFKQATDETPLAYLQQIRLEVAKRELEATMENIDDITRKVGYQDSSTFRRLFKKYTSLSPREYREKFSICNPS